MGLPALFNLRGDVLKRCDRCAPTSSKETRYSFYSQNHMHISFLIDDVSRYYTYRTRLPEAMLDGLACGFVDQARQQFLK
jgi:hypothetical protein